MSADNLVAQLLAEVNALCQNGHYVYRSGRHGDAYVNKDAVYAYPQVVSTIAYRMALDAPVDAEIVAGAAVGGALLAQWVSYHCLRNDIRNTAMPRVRQRPRAVFADKTPEGGLSFKRGYDALVRGQRVLLVEDIVTTGLTLRQLLDATEEAGGQVVAAMPIVDRGLDMATWPSHVPFLPMVRFSLQSWAAEDCPLCAQDVPVNTDLGHGRQFLAEQAAKE